MSLFEDELRKAMERREPGEDFTARVLARVKQEESRKASRFAGSVPAIRFGRRLRAVCLGGRAAADFHGLIGYRQHVRAAQGRAAKEQLLAAMHIAGSTAA